MRTVVAQTADAACPASLPLRPLPCPDPIAVAASASLEPHAHRCPQCNTRYRCTGPDETGFSAPVCTGCYRVDAEQHAEKRRRIYSEAAAMLSRARHDGIQDSEIDSEDSAKNIVGA